jgi:hypothetical protein
MDKVAFGVYYRPVHMTWANLGVLTDNPTNMGWFHRGD